MMAMLLLWGKNWMMIRGSLCRLSSLGNALSTCLSHEYNFVDCYLRVLCLLKFNLCETGSKKVHLHSVICLAKGNTS